MNPQAFSLGSFWPGAIFWTVLYISDYSLTLTYARLYRRGVQDIVQFEGSLEITPYFQADIDSLRAVSPRFVAAMVFSWFYLAAVWWLSSRSTLHLYEFVLGALISSELTVHLRHLRNLYLFRTIVNSNAVQGRIQYARPAMLRMSAVEIFGFSAFFAVLFLFTSSWFLLGGAFSCFSRALKHRRLASEWSRQKAVPVQTASEPTAS